MNSQAAQKCPAARRRTTAAREAYFLYVERAAEGANEADGPFSAGCLAEADRDVRGHARAQRVAVRGLARIEDDLDGHALDNLHPVPRRVLGRQQREARARPRADRIDPAQIRVIVSALDDDLGAHARPYAPELSLLEVREHPDVVQGDDGEQRLARLHHLPDLDGLLGDEPGHRRTDRRVVEVELREAERDLRFLELGLSE